MRTASIATAEPAALSVAPVPACQESRWAPSITTSPALVRARDLGERVVGGRILVVEARAHVQLQLDLHVAVHQAGQAVVLLGGHDQRGHARVLALDAGAAAADEHDAGVGGADLDRGQDLLRDEEGTQDALQAQRAERALPIDGGAAARRGATSNCASSSSSCSV